MRFFDSARRCLVALCFWVLAFPSVASAQVDFVALRDAARPTGAGPAPALGDFDEDGHVDAVSAEGNNLRVLLNDGLDTFRAGDFVFLGSPVTFVASFDLDADGHLDLVAGKRDGTPLSDSVGVVFGRGDGTFEARLTQ